MHHLLTKKLEDVFIAYHLLAKFEPNTTILLIDKDVFYKISKHGMSKLVIIVK